MRQNDRADLDDIGADISLSDMTKQTILSYPLPGQQPAEKFAAFTYFHTDAVRPVCGTVHNVASSEMLYCSSTTGAHFERRAKEIKTYADPVEAIVKSAARE
jgi:type IV secretion system protein TrbE